MAKQDYEEKYTHPDLREEIKEEIKASDKGGEKGQWSGPQVPAPDPGVREAGRRLQGREGPVPEEPREVDRGGVADQRGRRRRPRRTARPSATSRRRPGRT